MILIVSDYYSHQYGGDHHSKLGRLFSSVGDSSTALFIQPIWLD